MHRVKGSGREPNEDEQLPTRDQVHAAATRILDENGEHLAQIVAFFEENGLQCLHDGSHVVALVDPGDRAGQVAVRLFGLEQRAREFEEKLNSSEHDQAHKLALLTFIRRDALPDDMRDTLPIPMSAGTVPILIAAYGCCAMFRWTPRRGRALANGPSEGGA